MSMEKSERPFDAPARRLPLWRVFKEGAGKTPPLEPRARQQASFTHRPETLEPRGKSVNEVAKRWTGQVEAAGDAHGHWTDSGKPRKQAPTSLWHRASAYGAMILNFQITYYKISVIFSSSRNSKK